MVDGWGNDNDATAMRRAEERSRKAGASPEKARRAGASAVNDRNLAAAHPEPKVPEGQEVVDTPLLDDKSHAQLVHAAAEIGVASPDSLSKTELIHAIRDLLSPG